ncbi:hypothetical protein FACS1894104_4360 [Actinomycetota bacterium]|nr:hypothetical protein FACS1894104_4360 [Actinomycetota bacterium]
MLEQLQAILYFFGHGFCHQLPERSFEVGGLYFSVCARDTGIYLGLVFTVIVVCIYYHRYKIKPSGLPPIWAIIVCFVLVLPMAFDGATSYLGLRETTNLLRYITGYLCGAGIGVLASSAILSFRRDAIYTFKVAEKPVQLAAILTATAAAGAAFYLLYPYLGVVSPFIVLIAHLLIMTVVTLLVMNSVLRVGISGEINNNSRLVKLVLIAIMLALAEIALMALIAHGIHLAFPDFVHP